MTYIQVNLKRFDVSPDRGGIRPGTDPLQWMRETIAEVVEVTQGTEDAVEYTFFPPEALLPTSLESLREAKGEHRVAVGSQGVHWEDLSKGGNFGAFTTSFPPAAVLEYGATAALIGHSEERAKLADLFSRCLRLAVAEEDVAKTVREAVNERVLASARSALSRGLKVTFCLGETAEERGSEPVDFEKVFAVLRSQIAGLGALSEDDQVILAYEPRWAIGPGKTPPGPEYIEKIAAFLKTETKSIVGRPLPVLYGGGLKRENARGIGSIPTVDGGLIALTKFTPPIGFDAKEMRAIVDAFVEGTQGADT